MNEETAEDPVQSLRFDLQRAARYHRRRQASYESRHAWATGLAVALGSATFGSLLATIGHADYKWIAPTFAALVTIVATADLVFGFARSAWVHGNLASSYLRIERDLISLPEVTEEHIRRFRGEMLELTASEPPTLKVLNAICHNETVTAFLGPDGYQKHRYQTIRWYHRMTAPWFDVHASVIHR